MMNYISELFNNLMEKKRYYLMSLAWVLLICSFTYTALIVSFFVKSNVFSDAYFNNQHQVISMVVNIGLLVMVVFDYMSSANQLSNKKVILLLVGIVFAMIVYGHSKIFYEKCNSDYITPISWNGLSYTFHILFLLILFYLKAESLILEASKNSFIATPIKGADNQIK